jgi:predicted porin
MMTLSVAGAVAAAATAQEAPPPKIEAPQTASPKPGEPQTADPKTPTPAAQESNNLKFGFYGIADIAVLYRDHVLTGPKGGGQTDVVTLISGGHNQSRIGIRGSYDLGSGLRAVLQLEKGINYNDGTVEDGSSPALETLAKFFNRIAAVGLEKDGIGRFTVGRQLTTMYDMVIQFDPLAYSPTFSWLPTTGSADSKTGAINAGRFGSRVDNTIKYVGRFNGLQLGGYYGLGQNTTSFGANSKFGGGIIYTAGPLSAGLIYDQRNSDPGPYYREQATVIAAKLSLFGGWLTPTAGYRRYVRTMSSRADDLYFAGITLKVTDKLSLILADYYDKKRDGTGQNDNLAVARAEYALGKIVDVYATYGYASAESTGLVGVMRANDTLPVAGDQNGVSLGFRIRYGY